MDEEKRTHRKFPRDIGIHALAGISMEKRVLATMWTSGYADFRVQPFWAEAAEKALEEEKRMQEKEKKAPARPIAEEELVPTPPCHPLPRSLRNKMIALLGHKEVYVTCQECGRKMILNPRWILEYHAWK